MLVHYLIIIIFNFNYFIRVIYSYAITSAPIEPTIACSNPSNHANTSPTFSCINKPN